MKKKIKIVKGGKMENKKIIDCHLHALTQEEFKL